MQQMLVVVDGLGVGPAEHLVATTRGRNRSLVWPERAGWLWQHLCLAMPLLLSFVVMPDHLHLVAPAGLVSRLRRVLAGFTIRFGVRFDVLQPQAANSVAIAGRMIRYGFFNPVRAGLIDDPFSWPWSTLRDLVGGTEPVWTPLARVATTLREPAATTIRALTTLGDKRPPPPQRGRPVAAALDGVRDAVASALRLTHTRDLSKTAARRLIVQTSYAVGTPNPGELADALGCSVRSVHRDRSPRHAALDAALLCLGDPRLRNHGMRDPSRGRGVIVARPAEPIGR